MTFVFTPVAIYELPMIMLSDEVLLLRRTWEPFLMLIIRNTVRIEETVVE